MTALVISQRFATLKELETYYSYEDLLDMCEIIYINNINENLMYIFPARYAFMSRSNSCT